MFKVLESKKALTINSKRLFLMWKMMQERFEIFKVLESKKALTVNSERRFLMWKMM